MGCRTFLLRFIPGLGAFLLTSYNGFAHDRPEVQGWVTVCYSRDGEHGCLSSKVKIKVYPRKYDFIKKANYRKLAGNTHKQLIPQWRVIRFRQQFWVGI